MRSAGLVRSLLDSAYRYMWSLISKGKGCSREQGRGPLGSDGRTLLHSDLGDFDLFKTQARTLPEDPQKSVRHCAGETS
jgi:hypothetical protein